MLVSSAVGAVQVEQRGYRTVTSRAELERLGFSAPQRCVPALLIPLFGVHGEPVGYQIRPDQPRMGKDGKFVKYETPAKSQMVLDVPPSSRPMLGDPTKPLFITEGVKKGDSAATHGLCCVALLGVWNWRGTNDQGGKVALVEWDSIALNGRTVYIVFDSDVVSKSAVHMAMGRLKAYLEHRKAIVKAVYLPSGEGGVKVGMDDFFAAGRSVDELISHAEDDVRPIELDAAAAQSPYKITPEGIFLRSDAGWVALTNFAARITADVIHDDGVEEHRSFRIEGVLQGRVTLFEVKADEFGDLDWVATQMGAGATLFAIRGVEKHVRAAIQSESGILAPKIRVFGHTGWARFKEADVYLHAGGAIGELGVVNGVEVDLRAELARFRLPPPPVGEELREAIASVLRLFEIAPAHLSSIIVAAPLRAVLGATDFAVHLAGETGAFKTAIAALSQQFFGAGFDGRSLPASWVATENAIEALAFLAKDALLGVDDFAPTGGVDGMRKLQQIADRVFRSQGNSAGRARCATDGSLRTTRYPRGLILSTGEDIPRTASIRARLLIAFVAKGDVDPARLTEAQAAGRRGDYARAVSGFVQYVASRRAALQSRHAERVAEVRASVATDGAHRRVPGILADLFFGIESFIQFAIDSAALDAVAAREILARARTGIEESARAQGADQEEAEPAGRFLGLLRSAILAGDAHFRDRRGREPENPQAWGWQQPCTRGEPDRFPDAWIARGQMIGWVEGDNVYLDLDSALRAAQSVGASSGDPISILPTTLRRRLSDIGFLKSTDPNSSHFEVQRTLGGARRRVLHLSTSVFLGDTSETGTSPLPAAGSDAEPSAVDHSPASAASPRGAAWRCANCGGSEFWLTRSNRDRKCRACVPPVPGAEAL